MSDMALVRDLLAQAKDLTKNPEVEDLIEQAIAHSFRDYTKVRGPNKSRDLSLEDVRAIVREYRRHPEKSCQELAEQFNCNPGRVSEAIAGKHKRQLEEKQNVGF